MPNVFQAEGNPAVATLVDGDTYIVERGNQIFTSGTNLSGLAEGLAGAYFRRSANVQFTADLPLRVDIDSGAGAKLVNEMLAGRIYYWPDGDNDLCHRLVHLNSSETHCIGGGTVTRHEQRSGRTRHSRDVIATTIFILGGNYQAQYNSTAITSGMISGGTVNLNRAVSGTLNVVGGYLTVQREEVGDTVPTVGTLNVFGEGTRVKWKGGNITNLVGFGGAAIDFSEITGDITITNATVDDTFKKNSVWKSPNGTVTITNTLAVYGSETDTIPV